MVLPGCGPGVHGLLGRVFLLLKHLGLSQPTEWPWINNAILFCLPRKRNNFGGPWEVCLGFCSDFKWIVESGALIFKVVDRNPRLDQLLPGQGFSILVTLSLFWFRGLIVNICAFINNFCIHWSYVLQCKYFWYAKIISIISSYNIDNSFSDHRFCTSWFSESKDFVLSFEYILVKKYNKYRSTVPSDCVHTNTILV